METMERPCPVAGPFSSRTVYLLGDDVGRTWAFFALPDLEFDLLTFIEGCVSGGLDL